MLLHALLAGTKIARAAYRYEDELAYEREYADARAANNLVAAGIPQLEHELFAACTKVDATARLVLVDHDWSATELDGVRAAPASRHALSGFAFVCPGRHVLMTRVGDKSTPFHFVLYPGEILVRAKSGAGWASCGSDSAEHLRFVREAWTPAIAVDYWQTIARVRITAGAAKLSYEVVDETRRRVDGLVARVIGGEAPQKLAKEVNDVGVGLIGVALSRAQIDDIVRVLCFQVWELRTAGKVDLALTLCHLGHALLPEDPTLSAILASLLADQGAKPEARALLDAAAERDVGFTREGRALAESTRARLGEQT